MGDSYRVARYLGEELAGFSLDFQSLEPLFRASSTLERVIGLRLTVGAVLRSSEILLRVGSADANRLIGVTAEQHDLVTRLKSEAESVLEDIRRAEAAEPPSPADV
jgi:hypothetical protein